MNDLVPLFSIRSAMTREKSQKFECEYCSKTISGNSHSIKAHLFQHNAVKPRYVCKICLKPYFRKDTYVRHMNNHLQSGNVVIYVCDYCERGFRDKRNLINHLKVHDDSYYRLARRYKCQACSIAYYEERLLKHHIRRVHFNLERKENVHEQKHLHESWFEPINRSKTCVEMTKVKQNVISIKKSNLKVETEEKVKNLRNFIKFTDIANYSKVICDYCKKEMLKKSLITHIKEKHLKIRKFSCCKCKRTFKRHYQLVDHDCGKVRRMK